MLNQYRDVPVGNPEDGYSIREFSAGLAPVIARRLKVAEKDDSMPMHIWITHFVLACLHKDGVPVVVTTLQDLDCEILKEQLDQKELADITDSSKLNSIRSIYCNSSPELFSAIVEEFTFNISRENLDEIFKVVDATAYITKKKGEELKNDSIPEQTTGS